MVNACAMQRTRIRSRDHKKMRKSNQHRESPSSAATPISTPSTTAIPRTAPTSTTTSSVGIVFFIVVANRWSAPLELRTQFPTCLAHVGIAHVHLSKEMIRQPPVVVEPTQVRTADIADLQLLVTRWPRGILQILEVSFVGFFLVLRRADFVQFVHSHRHRARLAKDGDLEKAGVDGVVEVGDLFQLERKSVQDAHNAEKENPYKVVCLPNLVRRLFQPALRRVDASVTVVDVFLHVAHVVEIKAPLCLLCR